MFDFIQGVIINLPVKLDRFKIKFSEQLAIIKKSKIYSDIKWTDSQQKEFDDYWISHYGKKIKPWWNKLYESMNGVYRKDYFPEMLYSTKLEPALNSPDYCRIFNDKSLISSIYGSVKNVVFPKTYLVCCNGTFCDGEHSLLNKSAAVNLVKNIGECVIKPTVESGSGHGVHILNIIDGKDLKSGKAIGKIIDTCGENFIVQEKVQNSDRFATLYPASLNTVRITTYIVGNEIHYVPLAMRMGVGGTEIDNIHSGGIGVGINDDGTLKSTAYQLGYGDKAIKYSSHPDTGITFDNYYIGDIAKVVNAAKELHSLTPHLGIISWDLTFDREENVVMIEANCSGQGVWFPQIINGDSLFGKDTPYMIKKIRKNR